MVWIYHEKQEGHLCGQHCLNNLVQSCIFSAVDLAEIAQEFDAREKQIMLADGIITSDTIKFFQEESGNVDESGNFSIQVLSEALNRTFGLKLVSVNSNSISQEVQLKGYNEEEGFVCNRQSHWFSIRKVNGKFWNVNSTLEQPEIITPYALEANLHQLRLDGYSVFVVRGGSLPISPQIGPESGGLYSDWYIESDLLNPSFQAQHSKQHAGKNSKDIWGIAGPGQRLDGKVGPNIQSLETQEETQLAEAIALSLAGEERIKEVDFGILIDEPMADEKDAVKIQVKFPTKKVVRRFHKGCSALQLWSFVANELSQDKSPTQLFDLIGPLGALLSPSEIFLRNGTIDSENFGSSSLTVRLK